MAISTKSKEYELIAQCTALSSYILKSFRSNASNCLQHVGFVIHRSNDSSVTISVLSQWL